MIPLGFCAALLGLAGAAARPLNEADEAWFLRVVDRSTHGGVLYRNVFFGTTPLSVWLSQAAGATIISIRLLGLAFFLLEALLAWAILEDLETGAAVQLGVLAALLVYCSPLSEVHVNLYSRMATAFGLAAAWLTLRLVAAAEGGDRGRSRWLAASAGAAAGLSFASKHYAGILVLVACGVSILVWEAPGLERLADRALALGGFAAVSFLVLVPIAAFSSWSRFWDYAFASKSTFLLSAGTSYLDGIGQMFRGSFVSGAHGYSGFAFTAMLVPPAAAGLMAFSLRGAQAGPARRMGTVGLFAVAILLGAFPRADVDHLDAVLPGVIVAAGAAVALRPRRSYFSRELAALAAIPLAAGLLIESGAAAQTFAGTAPAPSSMGSFSGVRLSPQLPRLREDLEAIRSLTGGRVFIVSSSAGYLYLAGGLQNPTPFDYPLRTALGSGGEESLGRMIRSGEPRWICLGRDPRDELWPIDVEAATKASRAMIRSFAMCDLFGPPGR